MHNNKIHFREYFCVFRCLKVISIEKPFDHLSMISAEISPEIDFPGITPAKSLRSPEDSVLADEHWRKTSHMSHHQTHSSRFL